MDLHPTGHRDFFALEVPSLLQGRDFAMRRDGPEHWAAVDYALADRLASVVAAIGLACLIIGILLQGAGVWIS